MATANCQEKDTSDVFNYDKDVPGWVKEKIIQMSLNEKQYGMAKVYRYEINDRYIFHIYNPLNSCIYCELYDEYGKRLNPDEAKYFNEHKGEPLLIWENRPPIPFDSLKRTKHDSS